MTRTVELTCPVCQTDKAVEIVVQITLDDAYNETDPVCRAEGCELSRSDEDALVERAIERAASDLRSAIADGAA